MRIGYLALGLVVVLMAAQLIPLDRSNPPVTQDVAAPATVKAVLRNACYDCHSNETVWPWYAYVAPVSWLIAHDVEEGREHLNFSNWDEQSASPKFGKHLDEIAETVREGEMPPWYYALMHPLADVSAHEESALIAWASALSATVPHAPGKASDADSDE